MMIKLFQKLLSCSLLLFMLTWLHLCVGDSCVLSGRPSLSGASCSVVANVGWKWGGCVSYFLWSTSTVHLWQDCRRSSIIVKRTNSKCIKFNELTVNDYIVSLLTSLLKGKNIGAIIVVNHYYNVLWSKLDYLFLVTCSDIYTARKQYLSQFMKGK